MFGWSTIPIDRGLVGWIHTHFCWWWNSTRYKMQPNNAIGKTNTQETTWFILTIAVWSSRDFLFVLWCASILRRNRYFNFNRNLSPHMLSYRPSITYVNFEEMNNFFLNGRNKSVRFWIWRPRCPKHTPSIRLQQHSGFCSIHDSSTMTHRCVGLFK